MNPFRVYRKNGLNGLNGADNFWPRPEIQVDGLKDAVLRDLERLPLQGHAETIAVLNTRTAGGGMGIFKVTRDAVKLERIA